MIHPHRYKVVAIDEYYRFKEFQKILFISYDPTNHDRTWKLLFEPFGEWFFADDMIAYDCADRRLPPLIRLVKK